MRLIDSNHEFVVNGSPVEGFPILLSSAGDVHRPALNFLVYYCIQRGRVNSKKSWHRYGQDLYDFFSFIEAHSLEWRDTNKHPSILATYRDWSLKHFSLSVNTINTRLTTLVNFYKYAYRQNWVRSFPFEIEQVRIPRREHFLMHGDFHDHKATPDVKLKTAKKGIKVLTGNQQRILLQACKNETLKSQTLLGLSTGLRLEEINTFPLKYVFNPSKDPSRNYFRVTLCPSDMNTKGSKERFIDVPRDVMLVLWGYVHSERVSRLGEEGNTATLNKKGRATLFVNRFGKAFAPDSDTLRINYSRLGLDFHVNPHMLRHTFATNTLKYLSDRRTSSFDPLIYVRDRLGHESIVTTQKYLHFLEKLEDDLQIEYHRQLTEYVLDAGLDVV